MAESGPAIAPSITSALTKIELHSAVTTPPVSVTVNRETGSSSSSAVKSPSGSEKTPNNSKEIPFTSPKASPQESPESDHPNPHPENNKNTPPPSDRENPTADQNRPAEIRDNKPRNHYEILGLPKNATPEQIKAAFRTLAKEYHPDVNKNPEATEQFKMLNEAWQILMDQEKRASYDRQLEDLDRVSKAAEYASNMMPGKAKFAYTNAGYEIISGIPMQQLTPDQLAAYTPAAIIVSAEQLYSAIKNPDDTKIQLIQVMGPAESQALSALLEAGSKKDAESMVLMLIILSIINALQVLEAAATNDPEMRGDAFNDMAENSRAAGLMINALRDTKDIGQAINNLTNRLTANQKLKSL